MARRARKVKPRSVMTQSEGWLRAAELVEAGRYERLCYAVHLLEVNALVDQASGKAMVKRLEERGRQGPFWGVDPAGRADRIAWAREQATHL